jgi:hypothetical protein
MYKFILFLGILFFSWSAKAHQPDVSTTMLIERENNTWVLQISASLTAFQQEVRTHFSETPYKTPAAFKEMVLTHVKNTLDIKLNNMVDISFGKGSVILGHETKVVFEIFGIPADIQSLYVKNEVFKDIHRSQSALVISKDGFTKEHFVLNDANNHTFELEVKGNAFVAIADTKNDEVVTSEASFTSSSLLIIGFGILGALCISLFWFMKFSNLKKEEVAPQKVFRIKLDDE